MELTGVRRATKPVESDSVAELVTDARVTWTDAEVARLRELWANGRSAAQVAREIGCSRLAVIGKAQRLGLRRRDTADAACSISAVPRSPPLTGNDLARAGKAFADRARALARLEAQLRREPVAPEVHSPESRPCSFMELTRDTCRWPVGDPDTPGFYFCGAPPDAGHVYCAHHRHIAHAREEDDCSS
jgi:GcrA cell cycle regulator